MSDGQMPEANTHFRHMERMTEHAAMIRESTVEVQMVAVAVLVLHTVAAAMTWAIPEYSAF
jgi:hypothetical protein